jgi:NADH-ubiquinone oxidoreductase chain 4
MIGFQIGVLDSNNFHELAAIIVLIAMLVKLPVYGLHLWLPKAHVEAPVAGSILLAAVILKLGVYGAYRLVFFFGFSVISQQH